MSQTTDRPVTKRLIQILWIALILFAATWVAMCTIYYDVGKRFMPEEGFLVVWIAGALLFAFTAFLQWREKKKTQP